MAGRSEKRTDSQAISMSFSLERAKELMIGPFTSWAMLLTASASPEEATAKPASITSTLRRANCLAISNFS